MLILVDKDIEEKVAKFQAICGTTGRNLGGKIRVKVMALPILICGTES